MSAPGTGNTPSGRTIFIALAAMTAVAAVLRFVGLNSELWYDEIKTLIESVRPPLAVIVAEFPSNNDHPLYSLLAHFSIGAFGEAPWSLRLPSVLFAIATIPLLYVFGRKATGAKEALIAAALLAVSYHHIWYAQSARGYTMLLFFTLATSALLVEAMKAPKAKTYALYALAAALGCYTHLTMVYVVVAHAMIIGVRQLVADKGRIRFASYYLPAFGFVLAGFLTLLLYLPLFADVATFFEEKKVEPAKQVATAGWALMETIKGLNVGFAGVAGAVIALGVLAVGYLSYLRQSVVLAALFVLPAPVIVAAAVLLQRPMFPRFFFVLAGFALLVLVRGAFVIGREAAMRAPPPKFLGPREEGWGVALSLLLIAASIAALPAQYAAPKQNYSAAVAFLDREAAGDPVYLLNISAGLPMADYYERAWPVMFTLEEVEKAARGPSWIAYTFEDYIRLRTPDIFAALEERCVRKASFAGTVSGSDVIVMQCGGRAS